jgi:DNA-binding response OmpR family regulator
VSARVLVADGNTQRAAAIVRACSKRGFETRVVHQGAAALEAALSEVPDAIVCQLGLPLIEGSRLEGILRANPHTQAVTLVYLADQTADAERLAVGGRILAPPIEPDQVAARLEAALGTLEAALGAPPEPVRDRQPFAAEHAARLREWLELDQPGARPRRDAKVVVLSTRSGVLRDFTALLARLPGAAFDTGLEVGPADLVSLGRVSVDAQIGIEFLHVPVGPAFKPAWPVAGHGALATLVLLAAPLGPAVADVRAAREGLTADPCARSYHLVLLGKGESVAAEDVRENLAIADEGSLFPIPLDSADEADRLLRDLLERMLP